MSDFPSLKNELRQASKPRLDLALKPKPELSDEAVDANSRSIGERYGSTTSLSTPGKSAPAVAPLTSVRFDCPNYLDRELSVKAAEQGVTKTYLILQALGQGGYRLDPADLVKDRRRSKR